MRSTTRTEIKSQRAKRQAQGVRTRRKVITTSVAIGLAICSVAGQAAGFVTGLITGK